MSCLSCLPSTFSPFTFISLAGTVLLHLFAGSLTRRHIITNTKNKPIPSLYIPVPSPFPALESFIDQCVEEYDLDLFRCVPDFRLGCGLNGDRHSSGNETAHGNLHGNMMLFPVESIASPSEPSSRSSPSPGIKAVGKSKGGEGMRRGLELYKERYPNIDAILVGTRRGDPHGGESCPLPSHIPSEPTLTKQKRNYPTET